MPYLGACEICLYLGHVVRDHNHATGYIRGWLCNRCNRCLGVLENRHRFAGVYPKDVPKKLFKWWKWQFREEIERHLAKNTGIPYDCEGENRPESLPTRERVVETIGARKPPPARRQKRAKKSKKLKVKHPKVQRRVLSKRDAEATAALEDYRRRVKLWQHPERP